MSRTQFQMELESVRQNLVRMGETCIALLHEAARAITDPDPALGVHASELESQTDHQHRLIHDECLNLITRQAPVARDARLITGILDAIVDLELIGDYSYEMVTLSSSVRRRVPSQVMTQLADLASKVRGLLAAAIDQWRDGASVPAPVRGQESAIRADCAVLYEKLSQLTAAPGDATPYVDLMLITRHLERILRHAVCVADQAAGAAPWEQAQAQG